MPMPETYLLLDCDYLTHRAFHAMGNALRFQDVKTGAVYGFLRDLKTLQDDFCTDKLLFCFDHGKSKRQEFFPGYKYKRRASQSNVDPLMMEAKAELRRQLDALKSSYLPDMGYRNVFYQDGYEADDVIASLVEHTIPHTENAVIVSADKDLYQLLDLDRVVVYNPSAKQAVTEDDFRDEWGVPPCDWPLVKAIAGCVTDCVPGLCKGIGEKTAAAYVAGNLRGVSRVAHRQFLEQLDPESDEFLARNLKLVRLPFDGTKKFPVAVDECTPRKRRRVLDSLRIKTL